MLYNKYYKITIIAIYVLSIKLAYFSEQLYLFN